MKQFRLGTRGSPLALVQANMVRAALIAAHGWAPGSVEIVPLSTVGDRVLDRPLAEIGGKALWTQEFDRALLAGEIDCAVHSMKDVETFRPDTIAIAAMLPRADVRDRIVGVESVAALRPGAVVGTSSPRRAAQVRRLRPDVTTKTFRGNVATRLAKLGAGDADATFLAAAGLERLGQLDVGSPVPVETMLPAPAQGAVGIETLAANDEARKLLAAIDHDETRACVMAERALLTVLNADCHSPVGALAVLREGDLYVRAELLSEDGSAQVSGEGADPQALARDLLASAPEAIRALFGT